MDNIATTQLSDPASEALINSQSKSYFAISRIKLLYIVALATVALLSIVGQFFVQRALVRQNSDAHVVNIAGRQRMLSQKLSKLALIINSVEIDSIDINSVDEPNHRKQRLVELKETLANWQQAHNGLQYANQLLDLPGDNSPAVAQMYAQIEPHYQAIVSAVNEILTQLATEDGLAVKDSLTISIKTILEHEPAYLIGMEKIVFQYDQEAKARVTHLKRIELSLLMITLLVLLLEGLYIFRPAVNFLAQAIDELKAAISKSQKLNEQLAISRSERLVELEKVRKRIASDLHDDIGSTLTRISILSEVIIQKIGADQPVVTDQLSIIAQSSRELIDSMSDIVWAINPQKEGLQDLTQRMRYFASDIFTSKNIALQFRATGEQTNIQLGANIRREIFLIFKEAVNNIVRHSQCTSVNIEIALTNNLLSLKLKDNGKGFDLAQQSKGHGLTSMHDRADSINGQLEVISNIDQGMQVNLTVPISLQLMPV